jgi:hypothetical protein
MGLGQVSWVDIPTQASDASPETSWQIVHCVPPHCHVEESMSHSSTFQVFSSHPFIKGCQNFLIVNLVNCLDLQALNQCVQSIIYRVPQEECARLQGGVPYVNIYWYNPKHLCPKLNGYGDNGQRKVRSCVCSANYT